MNHEIHEKAETLADIRKEVEGRFRKLCIEHVNGIGHLQAMQEFNHVFDRIEAAWKRERAEIEADALAVGGVVEAAAKRATADKSSAVGNAAAMREALAGLIDGICFHCDLSEDCKGAPCEKMQKAKAALALPRRQCDVGTAVEQAERFEDFCFKHIGCAEETEGWNCVGCPLVNASKNITQPCELYWAQMPYDAAKESEAKG